MHRPTIHSLAWPSCAMAALMLSHRMRHTRTMAVVAVVCGPARNLSLEPMAMH